LLQAAKTATSINRANTRERTLIFFIIFSFNNFIDIKNAERAKPRPAKVFVLLTVD
jgi:hypothetical protein